MRHIKIFEEYSDEELNSLRDDLHDIGHKTKFVQGEDFGIGPNFSSGGPYQDVYISDELFNHLLKKGEISKNGSLFAYYFKNYEKIGVQNPNFFEIRSEGKESKYYITFFEDFTKDQKEMQKKLLKYLSEIKI
jgi:hypothetical protein